jgi:hypothetical protein
VLVLPADRQCLCEQPSAAPGLMERACVCAGGVLCPAVQVQVWDTQDEESMDPLLNIADGFDAEVRGVVQGSRGSNGFRVQGCVCARVCDPARLSSSRR